MCNQEKEVKVSNDLNELKEDVLRTQRLQARVEMMRSLPAVISAFTPMIESIAKVSISRHETLGSRLAEIELDQANRGQNTVDLIVDICKEFGILENIGRLFHSETELQLAINNKEIEALEKGFDNDDDDDNDDDNDDDDDVIDGDGRKYNHRRNPSTGYYDLKRRCSCKGKGC